MSKFSNLKLLLILGVLLAMIAVVKFLDSQKGERNFRSELVTIDSAKVTSILIYPKSKKGQEVKLYKEGSDWKVHINENKSQSVSRDRISQLFKTIDDIKPVRLAARNADKWKEFEVDTSGTRLIVKQGDKKTLDIVIGKFSFSGGRNVETFVRLEGDNETYAVNGFLEGTFNSGIDDWRDKTIIKGDKDAWKKLTFSLADTMKYQLVRQGTYWQLDSDTALQQEVNNYLNSTATMTGIAFADDVDAASLGMPQYVLEIADTAGATIRVEGFALADKKIIRSSLNTDNLINGSQGGVFDRIFVNRSRFAVADTVTVQ